MRTEQIKGTKRLSTQILGWTVNGGMVQIELFCLDGVYYNPRHQFREDLEKLSKDFSDSCFQPCLISQDSLHICIS